MYSRNIRKTAIWFNWMGGVAGQSGLAHYNLVAATACQEHTHTSGMYSQAGTVQFPSCQCKQEQIWNAATGMTISLMMRLPAAAAACKSPIQKKIDKAPIIKNRNNKIHAYFYFSPNSNYQDNKQAKSWWAHSRAMIMCIWVRKCRLWNLKIQNFTLI